MHATVMDQTSEWHIVQLLYNTFLLLNFLENGILKLFKYSLCLFCLVTVHQGENYSLLVIKQQSASRESQQCTLRQINGIKPEIQGNQRKAHNFSPRYSFFLPLQTQPRFMLSGAAQKVTPVIFWGALLQAIQRKKNNHYPRDQSPRCSHGNISTLWVNQRESRDCGLLSKRIRTEQEQLICWQAVKIILSSWSEVNSDGGDWL